MKMNIVREIILILLCSFATLIGPTIWINAEIKVGFMLGGLVYSTICLIVSYSVRFFEVYVLGRFRDSTRWLWGTAIGFIPFFSFILEWGGIMVFFEFHRSSALFNLPIILFLLLVLVVFLTLKKSSLYWSIYESGLNFIFPLFLIVLLMPKIPNSEGKVIIGNVAILYCFFKTIFVNLGIFQIQND